MNGGENQVAGHRRLRSRDRGLLVSDLSDEDDVWILAQHRTESARKGHSLLGMNLSLRDARQFVLDRVFDGHDVDSAIGELPQRAV